MRRDACSAMRCDGNAMHASLCMQSPGTASLRTQLAARGQRVPRARDLHRAGSHSQRADHALAHVGTQLAAARARAPAAFGCCAVSTPPPVRCVGGCWPLRGLTRRQSVRRSGAADCRCALAVPPRWRVGLYQALAGLALLHRTSCEPYRHAPAPLRHAGLFTRPRGRRHAAWDGTPLGSLLLLVLRGRPLSKRASGYLCGGDWHRQWDTVSQPDAFCGAVRRTPHTSMFRMPQCSAVLATSALRTYLVCAPSSSVVTRSRLLSPPRRSSRSR